MVDLAEIVRGEYAENTVRKDFLPTEAVAIGEAVEPLEREASRERQIELGRTHGTPSGNLPEGVKGDVAPRPARHVPLQSPDCPHLARKRKAAGVSASPGSLRALSPTRRQ